MKKIFLFAGMLGITVTAMAQKPNYGLKAGLNLANLTNTNGNFRAGFHAGALAHIHFTPQVSVQPEVMYSLQGAKYNSNGRYNLHYVNIPVLLQYNFSDGFRLQGGPQVGILAAATYKLTGTNGSGADVSNVFRTIDFSIPLGVSYLGKTGLGLDARYNIGVSHIGEDNTSFQSNRNAVIQFGIFYLLNHRHKDQSR